MFRYERMPSDLTWRSAAWYVVDRERDVWLESLGTNGPEGHRVFALCVRGTKVPFEVDTRAVLDGVEMYEVSSFGYSFKAQNSNGIEPYRVPEDPEVALALEELAVEGMLAFLVAAAHRRGYDPGDLQVRLSARKAGVRRLSDFGYADGVPAEVDHR
ncbi:hypothetical protein [Cellulomonas xiejunii]|uniref:Uncharacterized protein n=1 Tax=Cellulomonas xiejunii TaxID=2968083 RepID=A0ABY5KT54_9CELL|nr:hypothetical protein [Cellulomonas xiejunii]MCC2314062.1 hypothetical protein [Cellulomonas xiejunii]MCC2322314.1 hypothetical protein [Cellulomonas xiejunii]UUI72366.1 hypothetical protein NP048_02530 [Cellulomonas xiejunii]